MIESYLKKTVQTSQQSETLGKGARKNIRYYRGRL